jgi:glutaminyl-peptide cyclotransferase
MKLEHGRFWTAAVLFAGIVTIPTPWAFGEDAGGDAAVKPQAAAAVVPPVNPLDGPRAFGYLEEICALGSRMSGSPGMKKQQELLEAHFKGLGGKVSYQNFLAKNPLNPDGAKVPMANMLVEWHPERMERILLVAHYDTRPLPDRDVDPAKRKNGLFVGANDGGSGTALLMELAHLMQKFDGPLGVDFLLVDGEELVYVERRDLYCLGSRWFAEQYAKNPPKYKYRWGVVLDMIGDADLQVYQEQLSMTWRDSRPMVRDIWLTAGRLGVKEFIPRVGYEVSDDHVPIRNVAKIPACDIIDFNYMPWHQSSDTPQKCSGTSMAKVGWVVLEWMKGERAAKPAAAGN